MWYFLLVVLVIALIIYVVGCYIKDRRSTKQKTVESLGDDLWKEIDRERQESVERGKLFRKTLERAKKEKKRN